MILGKHSVDETRAIQRLVEYRFGEVDKGFNRILQENKPVDPLVYEDLKHDWETEKAHWEQVKKDVGLVINRLTMLNPIPEDLIASEDEYKTILGFVEYGGGTLGPNGQPADRRKGDLRDCQARIEKILGQAIDLSKRPDIITNDPDIKIYKKADTAIKTGEGAAKDVGKDLTSALKSNPGLVLGGAIALIVGGVVLGKVYL